MIESKPGVQDIVRLVRPEVRASHEYIVGSFPDIQVKLNQNESPLNLPEPLRSELVEAVAQAQFNRYPAEFPHALRAALAAQNGVPEESIIVGNGSNELTYTLGMCFVAPGTPVVVPRPMFSLYEAMIRLHGGAVVPVAPRDDLSFDVDGLLAAMARTGAPLTIVTTPNNPTGLTVSRSDLERLIEAAPGVIVVDEAYVEFNPEGSVVDQLREWPNLLILRTLSKAFGLAGLRVGYLMGNPEIIHEMMKSRLPFMVDRIAEAAALSVLRNEGVVAERVAHMKTWTADLAQSLSGIQGVTVLTGNTNFLLFQTPLTPTLVMERLAEDGILIRNMGGYPELKGYLRVSTGTPQENRLFLDALERALTAPSEG
ncbi:MAG: histidinol-phosphate transaminase [Rhodothermales bacterium]|nr:histidinol-phosphate transaminase [Rhodothermales bacterium]